MYSNMNNGCMQMPKNLTKSEREAFVVQNCGMTVNQVKKLNESTVQIKHSCYQTGVTLLSRFQMNVPMQYGYIPMYYYMCPSCGRLYIVNSEV